MSGRPGTGGHPGGGAPGGAGGPAGAAAGGRARPGGAAGADGPGRPPMRRGGFGGGPGAHMGMMMSAEKSKDFRGSFRRLLGELRPEARQIVLVMLLAIVSVAFAVVGPKILGNATNILFEGVVGKQIPAGVTAEQAVAGLRAQGQTQLADMLASMNVKPGAGVDFGALGNILLVLIGIYLLSSLFSWAQSYIMAGATQRTVYRMRRQVDEKLARLPLRYFDSHSRGDILSRVTNDIDNISQTLQQSLTQLITSLFTIIGVLIMMFWISPLLAVIALLTIPLSIVMTILIARRSQKQFAAQWESTGALNGHVEEMHTGHNIVKVFGHRDEALETFDRENQRLFLASYRAQFISGIIQPSMNFIANLNYVAICVIGGVRVANGQMSLGDVQAFIQYTRQFTMPIVQAASIMNVLQSAVASAERVFELLDEAEEAPDTATPRPLHDAVGRVVLDDVSFRYEPETPLIEDLNLVVNPGQTVAIVGPTGAGKTTLVNLLMRFYEIDGGRITVDGIDTREVTRDDLRRTFGMVLQDAWLFKGTIRENIAYGMDDVSEEAILDAARAAHVDHFVRTLAAGYDTVLDDEASNVSQGERQLITIARAFLIDPPILILDEATSSVDTRTEVLIQRAMAKLMKGRTSFVIAHRLSTIRDADTILVMNHGRIIEQGTHEELLAQQRLLRRPLQQPVRRGARPGGLRDPRWPGALSCRACRPVRGAPIVVLGHGASGSAATMAPHVAGLRARGIDARAIDLPKGRAERAVPLFAALMAGGRAGAGRGHAAGERDVAAGPRPAAGAPVAAGPEIAVGGHSFGGRVASLAAADACDAGRPPLALVLLSYPLHPPGRPDDWDARTAHWPRLTCPVILLSGTSDPFAQPALLQRAVAERLPHAELVTYPRQGHGLAAVLDDVLDRVAAFVLSAARPG